ncbi:MAG: hypothetical protein EOP32_23000 [Rhodococcus sp. (in: high G+C Gram-positive bacteria)]|nr:MAG: hypothetical protein EOP32_23000 [Rhodococcus sp. (in: high G+C Gram-positive bacteria)]
MVRRGPGSGVLVAISRAAFGILERVYIEVDDLSRVATRFLTHLVVEARTRGYVRLDLETGTEDFFAPARRLYRQHGFTECPPFGDYCNDPNSIFFTLAL